MKKRSDLKNQKVTTGQTGRGDFWFDYPTWCLDWSGLKDLTGLAVFSVWVKRFDDMSGVRRTD